MMVLMFLDPKMGQPPAIQTFVSITPSEMLPRSCFAAKDALIKTDASRARCKVSRPA